VLKHLSDAPITAGLVTGVNKFIKKMLLADQYGFFGLFSINVFIIKWNRKRRFLR